MPVGRTAANNFLSFVIEVGVSESLNELRADAEFWLLDTTNDCRLVLVVAVNQTSRWMVFELYQRGGLQEIRLTLLQYLQQLCGSLRSSCNTPEAQ